MISFIFILISLLYSLTHLSSINQITVSTYQDTLGLFYSIYFIVFLFSIARHYLFFEKIAHYLKPLFPKLNKTELAIYLSSIFSGYPTNAKIIKDYHLPKKNTIKLLKFCHHPSLGFTIIVLGNHLFNDTKIGYLLFFIQVLSTLIITLFQPKEKDSFQPLIEKNENIIHLFKSSFLSSMSIFIYIFGFILVFRILIDMLPIKHILVTGMLEFSLGCLSLESNKFVLSTFFLSFSSLSVIFQTLSILEDDVSIFFLLKARLIQALIASLIAYVCSFFIF